MIRVDSLSCRAKLGLEIKLLRARLNNSRQCTSVNGLTVSGDYERSLLAYLSADSSNSRSLSVDNFYVRVYIVEATEATDWFVLKSEHAATVLGSYCHGNVAVQPVTSLYARRRPCLNNTTYRLLSELTMNIAVHFLGFIFMH